MVKVHVNEKDNEVSINIEKANFMWFVHYMDGYYRSTIELVDKLSIKDNDTLIYPVLFSFSHYFELWLKLFVLATNDSSDTKKLNLNIHCINDLIKDIEENYSQLLESYDVNTDSLYQIKSKYQYFAEFVLKGKYLSMSSRYPLDNQSEDIIINFNKIDEIQKDNYISFKDNIFDILKLTNEITKKFIKKWFSNHLEHIDLDSFTN